MDDLHPVIDERRHNAAHHPRSAQGTNEQKDDNGRCHIGDVKDDGFFKFLPRHFQKTHANQYAKGRNDKKGHLTGTGKRIAPVGTNSGHKHQYQDYQRQKRKEG